MRHLIAARGSLLIALVGGMLLLALASWRPGDLTAQNAPRTPPKEEQEEPAKSKAKAKAKPKEQREEPAKPKPKSKEEEEDPVKPKRKAPQVEEETPTKERPKASARPAIPGQNELAREAERTRNPNARQLFLELSIPHDIVTMLSGRTTNVEPVARYVDMQKAPLTGKLTLSPFNSEWKRLKEFPITGKEIQDFTPYERYALSRIDDFLKKSDAEHPGADPESAQARRDNLGEAEKALAVVIKFHDSARERGVREESEGWKALEQRLRDKLRDVQLGQVRALGQAHEWEEAFALSTRLTELYPKQEMVRKEIAILLAEHAKHSLNKGEYAAAQLQLQQLEEKFQGEKVAEPIRKELFSRAEALFGEGMRLKRENKRGDALAKLEAAEILYPQYHRLRDEILQLKNEYPVLYVGVHDLPEFMSPATAVTDSEKQAVELLFESLVQPTFDPARGMDFEPELAAHVPQLVPNGRLFQITRQAFWSNGDPVIAADVIRTVESLKAADWPGRNRAWAELLDHARAEGDPYHVQVLLSQGYLDPLSLMSFKILPYRANLTRADDAGFAKQPIGSGPFVYKGREGPYVVFTANPYYGVRPGKVGLPRIREIRFFRSEDPSTDYRTNRLHLLLDLPTSGYKVLKSAGNIPLSTFRNHRVYFLAVNHRKADLAKPEVRRALALSINRADILKTCFGADTDELHRPLNGPYPPDCWAYNPGVTKDGADPCKPELAKALAEKARVGQLKLTLKFPEGDEEVKEACLRIKEQVEKSTGIQIEPIALPPRQLHRAVDETHEYELAYYHHDYPSEDYWLWPLFDPQAVGAGGRNYLGYQNDGQLVSLFRKAQSHREFAEVQRLTHQIHQHLFDQMPLIPLWQLDTHMVIHPDLKPVHLDPLLIFNEVEKWTLATRAAK